MKSEDIAKLAGVSRSTVSRVINDYSNVPDETRRKVMKVIEEYDYRPNAFARTLAGKKSETIGVFFIIENSIEGELQLTYNDFYTAYLDAIVDVANQKGYYVLVQTICKEEDYAKVNKAFREKRIDGGILIGTREDTLAKIEIDKIQDKLVIFDYELNTLSYLASTKNITILNSNDEVAISFAVEHLIERGHKHIGFIKGVESTLSARRRYDGFLKSMKLNLLTVNENHVLNGEFDQNVAYKEMKKAIDNKMIADSYICANDYMAIAAIECLRDYGYNVPKDVSFVGFDNTRSGQLMSPKLTTLTPDFFGMAKKAVEIIHLKSNDENANVPDMIEYKVDLLIRDSVENVIEVQ